MHNTQIKKDEFLYAKLYKYKIFRLHITMQFQFLKMENKKNVNFFYIVN